MTMVINQEICNGCGACVGACPNEAIFLRDGKALIDQTKCSLCQVCVAACPTGALQLAKTGSPIIPSKPSALDVIQPQMALESSSRRFNWSRTLLSLVGQHVLPRFVDILAAFLERRLSSPVQERPSITISPVENRPYRQRRRYRARFSKIYSERR
jgi:Fe-S-cluster-containing hydrogenase component 2